MSLLKIRMDTTERLLYLSFGLTVLVTAALIAGLFIPKSQNASQTGLLNEALNKLNSQSTTIENLSKDNKALNQQSINYAYCNAMIIARWTQTQQPIQVKDLNKCVLENQKNVSQALKQAMQQSEQQPSSSSATGNNAPQSLPNQIQQPTNSSPLPSTTTPLLVVPPLPTPCLMLGDVSLC